MPDILAFFYGADDGNRTRATSLGSWDSTIELRPRKNLFCVSCLYQSKVFVVSFESSLSFNA